ncbi:MAG: hypothetical protein AB8G22_09745, partial [Saprospiraceae bacterium]
MKIYTLLFVLLLALFLVSCDNEQDDVLPEIEEEQPLATSTEDILDIFTSEVVGTSTINRFSDRIEANIETSNLVNGHVYNIDVFITNQPEQCPETPCIFRDFQSIYDQIELSVVLADGFITISPD